MLQLPTPPAQVAIAPQQVAPQCTEQMPVCPVPAPVPPVLAERGSGRDVAHYVSDIAPNSSEPAYRFLVTVINRQGEEKILDVLTNRTRFWQISELVAYTAPGYGIFEILESDVPF